MISKIYPFVARALSPFVSDKTLMMVKFLFYEKRILNFKNPVLFSEKMQWIKLYGRLEKLSKYADKYEVREYVETIIGKKYLIPLIGVWTSFEEIPFGKLPKQFVLKGTHGSGLNFICKNKKNIDKRKLRRTINRWLKVDYYKLYKETQYKNCIPKIVCEKYMEDESGSLRDYKFFCFDGNPKFIQFDSDRYIQHKSDIYDLKWNKLPVTIGLPNSQTSIKKPLMYSKMLQLSKKLAKQFPLVRVDLYLIGRKIYFGELTFTPSDGFYEFKPSSFDLLFGNLVNLKSFKSNYK